MEMLSFPSCFAWCVPAARCGIAVDSNLEMCTDSTEGINGSGRNGLGRSQRYFRLAEGEVEPRGR